VVTPQEVTKATQRIPIVPPEVVAMTTPIVDPVADPVEEKNVMGKPRKK
jgi:hypothetical protein